ncbi:MAG: hypothetical protein HY704_05305 [Gemmatimonadetes bacterium]|nr:hypothetical protein [Gemmatimonadota bacterium]
MAVKHHGRPAVLLIAIAVVGGGAYGIAAGLDRLEDVKVVMAAGAKVLCSGVFVVGRDPDEYIANDAYPPEVDWQNARITVVIVRIE